MLVASEFVISPADDLIEQHPQLLQAANQLSSAYAERQAIEPEVLKAIGEQLWQAIDIEHEFDAEVKNAGTEMLPIVLDTSNPAIAQLPWEVLYHPTYKHLALSSRFTFSRKIVDKHKPSPLEKGPLRVLLFTSLPEYPEHEFTEQHRLDIEREQVQVLEALVPQIRAGKVKLEMPDDGRFESLRDSIRETKPHLVFLSGHGKFSQSMHANEVSKAVFEFEDEAGAPISIDVTELADIFVGNGVQCVVASSCESGKTSGKAHDGLIQHLAELGIPHVVGMRESVGDIVGQHFARYFCEQLSQENLISIAVQRARQSIEEIKKVPSYISNQLAAIELFKPQWTIPILYSSQCVQPIIDWDFKVQVQQYSQLNIQLFSIKQPKRFIGRRMELRQVQSDIKAGKLQWLFTGPGGQGKTALAGKIVQNLQRQGHTVYAWSASKYEHQPSNPMNDFITGLQKQLPEQLAAVYEANLPSDANDFDKALLLLNLICEQRRLEDPNGKVVLFLDNLETLQSEVNYDIVTLQVRQWIKAAQALGDHGLVLIATSRWRMTDWPEEHCIQLSRLNYHDFLLLAKNLNTPKWLLSQSEKLRKLHKTLHGNGRGLEYFIKAIDAMDETEATTFEKSLEQAEEELQINMALNVIAAKLNDDDKTILHRMTAYDSPVPEQGVLLLIDELDGVTMEKTTAQASLNRLVNCSLLEQHNNQDEAEYFCSPVVTSWLHSENNKAFDIAPLSEAILSAAAALQMQLFKTNKQTFEQKLIVYHAYIKAKQNEDAYQFAYDYIVPQLELAGFSRTLLQDWMPTLLKAITPKLKGEILNRTGKLHHNLGEYDTALTNYEQSLKIAQDKKNKKSEGEVLNNISQIYSTKGDYDTALKYLEQSLQIYQKLDNKIGEGTNLNNISLIHHAKGNYNTALKYLKQTLQIDKDIDNKIGEGATLNNISQIHYAIGEYDTALKYLEQSLRIRKDIGDKKGEGTTLNNINLIYTTKGDYNNALKYVKQALQIQKDIGDKEGLCASLFNLGHIHWRNNEQEEAISTWLTVYNMAKPMELAVALQPLSKLADNIGLKGGLDGWEELLQQRNTTEDN